jgi:enamine deaminase RidA (YjgF/YER057c/UK114 family)
VTRKPLFPPGSKTVADPLQLSPGLLSGGHVFLSGVTGSGPDGAMPATVEAQFHQVFAKIGAVLHEAGLGHEAIVEMTSYHVGLRDHFDLFCAVRSTYLRPPYPAWTAVEVAGLRRDGALVEVRVIAALPPG